MMVLNRFARGLVAVSVLGTGLACGGAYQTAVDVVDDVDGDAIAFTSPVDLNAPRPNDGGGRRVRVLDNGLEVLLVSDPSFQKSAAALDVAVGSLEDPWDAEGMAHFLEHLLFLGTEKYPEVEDYDRYIASNQGSNNAYTAGDRTNYYLELTHEAFEGGLDRFAQFFTGPLFNPDYVERERNAVHSEHQKNLQDDFWRTRMIHRKHHRDGHPRQKFSTGDLGTLEGATRESIIEFYNKYYSANVMKLCVLSNRPLDEMDAMVADRFGAVPNRNRDKLEYPTDIFDPAQLPMLIEVKPVTDMRSLQLSFACPSLTDWWAAKPHRLISGLIGHEGEGSLLSKLERENLATSLSAYSRSESYAGTINVDISLTDKGRGEIDRIIGLFFGYVDMLRDQGLQPHIFQETKTVSDLAYFFRDHEEGGRVASSYAAAMQTYPAMEFEKRQSLISDYDPAMFASLLEYIQPGKVRLTVLAPDVEGEIIEDHYGTEYRLTRVDDGRVQGWKAGAAIARVEAGFHLPHENTFLPDDLTILENDPNDEPYFLIDDERGRFLFEQDKVFRVPRAEVSLLFLTEATNASPRDRLVASLYERCLQESLGEWIYPVYEAGLFAGLSTESRGVQLSFSGFSPRIPELMTAFGKKLTELDVAEDRYRAIQDEMKRGFANNELDQAYSQVFYEFGIFMNPEAIHRNAYRDLVDDVTLDEVRAFAKNMFERAAIEGVAYGNLDGAKLKGAIDELFGDLAGGILPADRRPGQDVVNLPDGKPLVKRFATRTDNNAWARFLQFGERDPKREAIIRIGTSHLEPGFYGEMRTKQQLGYIVGSGPLLRDDGQGVYYLIQSGTYAAGEVAKRANAYLAEAIPAMRDMDPEAFETIRTGVITELEEADKDISERVATLQFDGLRLGDFEYKQKVIAALRELTVAEVADAFAAASAAGNESRLDVYLDAVESESSETLDPVTADLMTVRGELPRY
jgi:insulysin